MPSTIANPTKEVALNEPNSFDAAAATAPAATSRPAAPVLPNLQMNVLRKHFAHIAVAPDEVAGLDHAALMRLPGIGRRGIEVIGAWLRAHGLELADPPSGASSDRRSELKRKRVEQAIALLRRNGFVVEKRGG